MIWDYTLVRADIRHASTASNLAFNEKVKQLQRDGRRVSHFAFGQSPFPVPRCAVEALREHADSHDYLDVAGLPELRRGICALHKRHDGLSLDPDHVIVGPGCKEVIYLTMTIFNGDILLVAPSWTTYEPQSRLAGHQPTVLRTDASSGHRLTSACLAAHLTSRQSKRHTMLVLNNPNNPTGLKYTETELIELASVCRQHGVIVVSDEIYGCLTFDRQHVSMAKVYPEGTILISGFSKWMSAGGWRVGYAHYPAQLEPLLAAVRSAGSNTFTCCPAPMQRALSRVLQPDYAGQLDCYADDCARILSGVGSFCARELAQEGVKVMPSQSGYYFMPDFEVCRAGLAARGIITGQQMVDAMLEEADVALMASSCFLMADTDLVTRFCFVCFDGGAALAALVASDGRVVDDGFVTTYCAELAAGVARLRAWVRAHSPHQPQQL